MIAKDVFEQDAKCETHMLDHQEVLYNNQRPIVSSRKHVNV